MTNRYNLFGYDVLHLSREDSIDYKTDILTRIDRYRLEDAPILIEYWTDSAHGTSVYVYDISNQYERCEVMAIEEVDDRTAYDELYGWLIQNVKRS